MLERRAEEVFQCGREITGEELDEIQETVGLFPKLNRTELAETLCEHLGWMTASGNYKRDACLKLLKKLESGGFVRLPEKRECRISGQRQRPILLTSRTDPESDIACKLKELGSLRVEVVTDRESTGLWNEYVSRYHYLGYKKPFGTFLRYFIVCDRGILGCILFTGAAKALRVRDRWIGWDDNEQVAFRGRRYYVGIRQKNRRQTSESQRF